jgi:branched-subunit amino acid transport protein
MTWFQLFIAGILTYFHRMTMIALIDREMFTDRIREVLSFVPSAIFPAIIFPAIFLDNTGNFIIENNPKILASLIAIIVGIFSKNIIATIFAGLAAYWYIIFI